MLSFRWILKISGILTALLATQAAALYEVMQFGKVPMAREIAAQYAWPAGTLDLVNDPARVEGWHPIFSECPNDSQTFGYRLDSTREANRLLKVLAQVKGERPAVLLDPKAEFRWDRHARVGYEATFAVGSRKVLEEWWRRLPGGKFGVHVYKEAPKARPPQFTLFVGSEKIALEQLRVPRELPVATLPAEELRKQKVPEALISRIQAFVKSHRSVREP